MADGFGVAGEQMRIRESGHGIRESGHGVRESGHGIRESNHGSEHMRIRESSHGNEQMRRQSNQSKKSNEKGRRVSRGDAKPVKYYYSLEEELEIDPDIAADMAKYLG